MITEAILGFFLDVIVGVLGFILDIVGAPISGTFSIPKPLFTIAEIMVIAYTAVYPAIAIWFLWRQIKA